MNSSKQTSVQYVIVNETSPKKLIPVVQALLDDGWKLQGGVSLSIDETFDHVAQALIKEVLK